MATSFCACVVVFFGLYTIMISSAVLIWGSVEYEVAEDPLEPTILTTERGLVGIGFTTAGIVSSYFEISTTDDTAEASVIVYKFEPGVVTWGELTFDDVCAGQTALGVALYETWSIPNAACDLNATALTLPDRQTSFFLLTAGYTLLMLVAMILGCCASCGPEKKPRLLTSIASVLSFLSFVALFVLLVLVSIYPYGHNLVFGFPSDGMFENAERTVLVRDSNRKVLLSVTVDRWTYGPVWAGIFVLNIVSFVIFVGYSIAASKLENWTMESSYSKV